MLKILTAIAVMAATGTATASAGDDFTWPDGKKAAIALTYDDSLASQLDYALPQLDAAGLKGTFFLTVNADAYIHRLDEWKEAADEGHELANHTLFHPCIGGPGRDFVTPDRNMDNYSEERWIAELKLTSDLLETIDGETERTFAYTCGDLTVSGESFVDAIRPMFIGARTVENTIADPATVDPMLIPTYGNAGVPGSELIAYAEKALEEGGLGTYLFHGVGGNHLVIEPEAHQELVDWLVAHEDEVWVATFRDIMAYVNAQRAE